jgi:WD40 repeat protein
VAYRNDGAQLAVACGAGELRVYDLPAMTESARIRLGFDVRAWTNSSHLAVAGNGRRAAVILPRWAGVAVYELAGGRLVREVKIPSPRRGLGYGELAMNHAGTLLAFAHDRAITVHDVATGETIAWLQGHQVTGAMPPAFQPGGHLLATAGRDRTIRLWDPVRGRLIAALAGQLVGWQHGGSRLVISRGEDLVIYRVTAAEERRTIDVRTFGDRPGQTLDGPARVEYSPDSRLIALPIRPDGVWIVRSSDRSPMALLPIDSCDEAAFLPGGDLLTYNMWGLCRWPVRRLSDGGRRLGPPEPVWRLAEATDLMFNELAVAASGRWVGTTRFEPGVILLDPDRPQRRTWLVFRPAKGELAISPDGRWAATADVRPASAARPVQVWDAANGRRLAALDAGPARVAFSPNGRWLGVGGSSRYRFYRTGSWEPVAEAEHGETGGVMPLAFHPGGRVAAVLADTSRGTARLIEVETGRVLATLEPPDPAITYAMAFSPDGRSLALSQTDQRVHIWDLAMIRRRLDELGLAAGFPDFAGGDVAPAPAHGAAAVERIEVVGADPVGFQRLRIMQVLWEMWLEFRRLADTALDDALDLSNRADGWMKLGYPRLAVADFRASLARQPESASTAVRLAYCLLDGSDREEPDEAARWARRALELDPKLDAARYILGVALYRAGRFAEAAPELEANIQRMPYSAGFNWLFLAMCRHRLGRTAEARAALAEAVRWRAAWTEKNAGRLALFQTQLREVQSALEGTLPDLPVDVFAR